MLFKNKRLNPARLLQNGFELAGEFFTRREKILSDLELTISVDGRGSVTTKIFDSDGELYTLHLVEGACGKFVGAVKAEHDRILNELAAQCFDDQNFFGRQTLNLIEFVREKFSDTPEFLWEKFPNCAIFRRQDNRKWYAVIMSIARKKLRLDGADDLEILNLRVDPDELNRLVDDEKYFRGWHMNKKLWLTLRLDETLSDTEIFSRLEQSYRLACKK